MKDISFDDWDDFDYDWDDETIELEEQLRMDAQPKKIVNNMNYKAFKNMNDKDKLTYLYIIIRDLYSYLFSIQDVVQGDG